MKINLKFKTTDTAIAIITIFMPLLLLAQVSGNKPYIPINKGLDNKWIESLLEKGEQKIYNDEELKYIAMPCGGIGTGQVEITGEGKLVFTESVYNQMQQPNTGHGLSSGYNYINPVVLESKVNNAFSIRIKEASGNYKVLRLNHQDFDDIQFIGEYPMSQLTYQKKNGKLPIEIKSEVFSPFVPLNLRSSSNPVTVIRYSIKNTSDKSVEVALSGWLKNIEFPIKSKVSYTNTIMKSKGVKGLSLEMNPKDTSESVMKHPQLGGFSLSVLDKNANVLVSNLSNETFLQQWEKGEKIKNSKQSYTSETAIGGQVVSHIKVAPNKTKVVTFLVTWYFPNAYENGKRYKQARDEAPGWVGHLYNNWYTNAFDVASYVSANFNALYSDTKHFRNTYHNTSLPYWLANRITMPVSTLAAGNIAIWKNGRLYAYEGIGFCQGTCGHVYNFVTAISKLFPELERSVRLLQDFNEDEPYSGYSKSGRINFRGYGANDPNAIHSYASDAQSGYVLKAYREHLNSKDNTFLDAIWDKVKMAIGYHIFKDGAEIGLEPNGVLEGKQTFWDPMWYGPNPYNNTLYLAALRAAEEMAKVQGEFNLAKRYHAIFETGSTFMNEHMWNGEYYVHLYPTGFKSDNGIRNGFSSPEVIDSNAEAFIKGFNNGAPNYYISTGCDAQQLFGQNWAHQLGLGYILPQQHCLTAANSIYQYNYTPDIGTVYNFQKPKHRTLAAIGEGAMVNGSWPKTPPKNFENLHDKANIWTGLEYEASCDMINEGLVKEGLVVIRSIHDRYNGTKRNPWNEIEGSDHYSRAMHSWNVLLSISGFTYNGPKGIIGYNPKLTPENFKSFFSASEGWGNYSQTKTNNIQTGSIHLAYGKLMLNTINLNVTPGKTVKQLDIHLNGKSLKASFEQKGDIVSINVDQTVQLNKNDKLSIQLK
ncbi:hypothetical protein AXE80_02925 [Wenyingzhuangia fucanilytica]|uniref:Glycosyl-hydrolase family 116 catalytic region domain-containing protein n=1 Tax=Wenyingzhuangia fucanilytica TaxID=1790137 RepID=A0A1B1Y3E1_9FLAO|nr:GH116 family glycosyl hydrolase [Wenyingzhuangia fucanilytica]ANW95302.1 hypothetical protein AXE80_02925 [Wenyingzhuangia fucanilytica]